MEIIIQFLNKIIIITQFS